MAKDPDEIDLDVADRLKTLRVYSKQPSQTAFAVKYGFPLKTWNNYERGYRIPSWEAIKLVRQIPGLTLDWIYLGKEDGLPGRLRAELEEAEILTNSPDERRSRR